MDGLQGRKRELPSEDRGDLKRAPGGLIQAVQAGGDDAGDVVSESDVLDLACGAEAAIRPLDEPGIEERADHLFKEEGVALGLGEDEVTGTVGEVLDVREIVEKGPGFVVRELLEE